MTGEEVLAFLRAVGLDVRLRGEDVVVRGRLTPDLVALARQHKADLLALLRQESRRRCPACGSVGHATPGAPGCDRREVLSARRYPAPLLWRGSEKEWTAGAPQPPLPSEQAKDKDEEDLF